MGQIFVVPKRDVKRGRPTSPSVLNSLYNFFELNSLRKIGISGAAVVGGGVGIQP